MKLTLRVKLQAPTVEVKIVAIDVSNTKDIIYVGFKRYEVEPAEAKLNEFMEILTSTSEGSFINPKLDAFIKREIVYIKSAELNYIDETGQEQSLKVNDTRTVKPNAAFWETSSDCLSVLVDLYLASVPTKVALTAQVQQALLNNDFSGASKN